jgi:transposase
MKQIKCIKKLKEKEGLSYREISRKTGHAFETVKKYAEMKDFNINLRKKTNKKSKGKFKLYEDTIRKWLIEDLKAPKKQRHTAQRVYNRLKEIYGEDFDVSDRSVRNWVARIKKEINLDKEGYLPLEHPPGEAQVDFGEAVFIENGEKYEGYYLSMSFPYSNGGYVQLFKGQNMECLLEGLKNIFEYIGKVPNCIWFDNMSPIVKKIKEYGKRDKTQGFERFELHYGFESTFCNLDSGHEKGSVENKIGYHRRNFFVPIPEFLSLEEYNKELLKTCDRDMNRKHYKKEKLIKELFEEDKKAMRPLPNKTFEVFRLEKAKADRYGKVSLDGKKYSISPAYAGKEVWVKVGAFKIDILDAEYNLLESHPRLYGRQKESMKWIPYLKLMAKRPTALKYSGFYKELPESLNQYFERCEYTEKKAALAALVKMIEDTDIKTAIKAFEISMAQGIIDLDSIWVTYYRIANQHLEVPEIKLSDKIPKIKEYEISTDEYDALLRGGKDSARLN